MDFVEDIFTTKSKKSFLLLRILRKLPESIRFTQSNLEFLKIRIRKVLGQLTPRQIAPPSPKVTLSQTLTLTGGWWGRGGFFSVAIVWLSPNHKNNPALEPNPNPNQGIIFLGWQLSGYQLENGNVKHSQRKSNFTLSLVASNV